MINQEIRDKEIVEKFENSVKITDIAKEFGVSRTRINQILQKAGAKQKNYNHSSKIDIYKSNEILELNKKDLSPKQISKLVDISASGVRQFLKKHNQPIHVSRVDRSRLCKNCGTTFTPKSYDGKKKKKYKSCSLQCARDLMSKAKLKYSKNDINKVIELKKQYKNHRVITQFTGVDINKIKEITKENSLFLTKEQAAKNAHEAKLIIDPMAMTKVREGHMDLSEEEFKIRMVLLEKDILDGKGTAGGLSHKYGLVPGSAAQFFRNNGKENLLNVQCSTGEIEVADFFKNNLTEQVVTNTRQVINPFELDVYIPELKLAVEYCGLYWHSEKYKDKEYHKSKLNACNRLGIRLITIFEDEWIYRRSQVEGFLLSVINKTTIRIGAKETTVSQIPKLQAKQFLKTYHIQGSSRIEIAFGLFYNGELVAVMTGSKHHWNSFSQVFVLNRLAFKNSMTISGGASRLLKHLSEYAKSQGYERIISWSDNRWSQGRVYSRMKFHLDKDWKPSYSYISYDIRLSKQSCKKKQLKDRKAIGKTEHEMAKSLGLLRIYDCGKKRWVFNL